MRVDIRKHMCVDMCAGMCVDMYGSECTEQLALPPAPFCPGRERCDNEVHALPEPAHMRFCMVFLSFWLDDHWSHSNTLLPFLVALCF